MEGGGREKVMVSEGRGGNAGELNLHARRVIWHRHGILGGGGEEVEEVEEIRGKVKKRIQDNRMCM